MSLVRGFLRSDRRVLATLVVALLLAPALVALVATLPEDASATFASARAIAPGLDSEGDGLTDLDEVRRWGTRPDRKDTDVDGLDDAWEARWSRPIEGTTRVCPDPLRADAQRDCIGKGVTLAEDQAAGTDPTRRDTDGDGLDDAVELRLGMDALRDDADADPFGNGLTHRMRATLEGRADRFDTACSGMSDAQKARRGLSLARASTGGSGVPDGWAIHFGLDPTDPLVGARRLDGDATGLTVLEKAAFSARVLDLCARPGEAPPFERGLDPRRNDTDRDGLPDAWEVRHGRDPLDRASATADPDNDGLTDLEEFLLEACPGAPDCDGDGLTDADEARTGWNVTVDGETRAVLSHPRRAVSDGDAIPDAAKRDGRWTLGDQTFSFAPLDPATPDTDADDLEDSAEILRFAGALRPDAKDTDADGIADGEEVAYWDARGAELCAACDADGDGLVNAADADADGDGLADGEEIEPRPHPIEPGSASRAAFPRSDPALADTDGDGLPDAWEKRHARFEATAGEWDLDPSRAGDGERDADEDGMTNAKELAAGTDPHDADSDDDGLPDGWEDRFGAASDARAGAVLAGRGFEWVLAAGEPIALSPLDDADAGEIVARYTQVRFEAGARTQRTVAWTYVDLWELGVSPAKPASGNDGIPDVYKALFLDEMPGAFDVPDADADGRSNRDEYVAGTDPLRTDTDGGGIDDHAEALAGLDPLEAGDDAGEGDLDGDGLSNGAELMTWRTRVDSPDTDNDALLDGADVVVAAGSPIAARFLSLGIAHHVEEGNLRFLAEARVSTDPAAGCARAWSCTGDGLPDAWKAYYDLGPGTYHPPTESRSADGLGIALEYSWGRPAWWNESQHGPWWLGLDPTRADTNRDGVRDDRHTRVDDVADLDRDGLNDLSGEDPTPYVGAIDLTDKRAVFASLQSRAGAAPAPTRPPSALTITSALPSSVDKGASFRVAGTLATPTPDVPVLARLVVGDTANARTSDPRLVHGVAFTRPDGSFSLDVELDRPHEALAPADVSLFGAPANGSIAWEADTAKLILGQSHRLVLWSHATDAIGNALLVADGSLHVGSAAKLAIQGELSGAPGTTLAIQATLQDGAGDLRPIADASAIRLSWRGELLAPTRIEGSNASFLVPLPADAAPAPIRARLTYAGDDTLREGESAFDVLPRLATRLALEPSARNATLGEAVELRGSLLDERGTPLARANVTLKLAGVSANATTDAAGRFAARLGIPAGATLGARAPTATFGGSPHHAPAVANGTAIGVRAAPVLVELAANASLGRLEVHGKLLAAGAPVVDPTLRGPPRVRVEVAGLSRVVTPGADGSFRATLVGPSIGRPAVYAVRVSSEPAPLVDPAAASIPIVLTGETRLVVEPSRGARGETALVRGSLRDALGEPIAFVEVVVNVGATSALARTDALGAFVARSGLPSGLPLGPLPIGASFAGSEVHRASGAASTLVVLARTSMSASRGVLDATAPTIELRFVDDTGSPRAGEPVALSIDERAAPAQVTSSDGAIRVSLPPAALSAPSVLLRARLEEGSSHAAFEAAERLFLEQPTRLEVIEAPSDVAPGERIAIKVRLTTAALGTAVLGATVELGLAGAVLASAQTAGAVATFEAKLPPDAALGATSIRASFRGMEAYLPSSVDVPLRVRSTLGISATASGAELLVEARSGDAPFANAPLVVEAGDAAFVVATNAEGRARASVPRQTEVVVRFLGSDEVAPQSVRAVSTSAPVVDEGATIHAPWLVVGALGLLVLALAAVASFLFLRYRRRAKDDVGAALAEAERAFRARDEHDAMVLLAYRTLVQALARRGLAHLAATPRETQLALADAFRLPAERLEDVIEAFELARYGGSAIGRETAMRAANALADVRHALREDAS